MNKTQNIKKKISSTPVYSNIYDYRLCTSLLRPFIFKFAKNVNVIKCLDLPGLISVCVCTEQQPSVLDERVRAKNKHNRSRGVYQVRQQAGGTQDAHGIIRRARSLSVPFPWMRGPWSEPPLGQDWDHVSQPDCRELDGTWAVNFRSKCSNCAGVPISLKGRRNKGTVKSAVLVVSSFVVV